MKIYTGFGDKGNTALFGGETVRKNNKRVQTYGTLDELNALVGLLRFKNLDSAIDQILINVQNELFTFGSEIATPDADKRAGFAETISNQHIENIENAIDRFSEKLPPLNKFILPGGSEAASYAHLARTICRRAERMLISLADDTHVRSELIIYLNRLSDFFFILARYENQLNNVDDVKWEGIKKK